VKILILSVGRPERSPFAPIFDDYAARIRKFGVALDARFVPEVEAGSRYSDAHVREREARAIEEALPPRARLVAFDPVGSSVTINGSDLARTSCLSFLVFLRGFARRIRMTAWKGYVYERIEMVGNTRSRPESLTPHRRARCR